MESGRYMLGNEGVYEKSPRATSTMVRIDVDARKQGLDYAAVETSSTARPLHAGLIHATPQKEILPGQWIRLFCCQSATGKRGIKRGQSLGTWHYALI